MADVTVRAPAKINLHLEVLGLRPDGYHELAMVMQSIDLADTLVLRSSADATIRLRCDNADLPTDGTNLIVKAAERLRSRVGLPELGVEITLRKRIPIGAGLAGGSSDGAAALVGLDALWGLGLGTERLHALAAELGSDMPFCLQGGTQLCFGRGERLEPMPQQQVAERAVLLLKHPQASVSTPWAYGRCRELRGDFYLESEADFEQRRQALRHGPLLAALADPGPLLPLRNDLQSVVAPEVESVRLGLDLLRRGPQALAVAMSGSGPSLYALFPDLAAAEAARSALAGELGALGFSSWCCRCGGSGVSLVTDGSPP
ncbi:4-(cytidine 5'-diphospho)-2-C-methyl-D-erythritol kinase [Cyanobium sp. Cruz CV13-4-11]|uniref:4-(cytidine 5'-diphospho)-2-C-methyl-D-erythritol kinase n=1 Tax=unclassified Cyanobium TaxID=2627006 RepID=UPI0020CF6B75|nr:MULTISPECIES: 4-(cytidine 5'-diphospho)-2-C-methyl-D-erythritol kinase [unclassified Cyanobium]MCP9899148.1 4-(cytidine 5'-diphospho)-2-C-methyl-D-erythritol kinase [Cyanobium sp. Cruz CV11-17]MCP9918106.1 4-(cytidine 5'-diphospho)-2-C-methyl-D-erythritol kinase [Cyanobium sp. Cruz CV13-4-11]